jgi:hypothetical protein
MTRMGGANPRRRLGSRSDRLELEDDAQILSDIAYAPMEFYEAGTNEAKGSISTWRMPWRETGGREFINTGFPDHPALLPGRRCCRPP